MLMYEIWSLGKKPFPNLSPTEVKCIKIGRCYLNSSYFLCTAITY